MVLGRKKEVMLKPEYISWQLALGERKKQRQNKGSFRTSFLCLSKQEVRMQGLKEPGLSAALGSHVLSHRDTMDRAKADLFWNGKTLKKLLLGICGERCCCHNKLIMKMRITQVFSISVRSFYLLIFCTFGSADNWQSTCEISIPLWAQLLELSLKLENAPRQENESNDFCSGVFIKNWLTLLGIWRHTWPK